MNFLWIFAQILSPLFVLFFNKMQSSIQSTMCLVLGLDPNSSLFCAFLAKRNKESSLECTLY